MTNQDIEYKIESLIRQRKNPACLRIGVAGGSGCGKSLVCKLIQQKLPPNSCEVISLDRFFKPVEQLPKYHSNYHQGDQPDFNTPDSLRVDEMVAFCRNLSSPAVVLLDGHFALYYPEMRELMDIKCFVNVDEQEMLQRRTERNLAAGYGGDRENILAYNRECVVPRHEGFIQPTLQYADLVIPNNNSDTMERDNIIRILVDRIRVDKN